MLIKESIEGLLSSRTKTGFSRGLLERNEEFFSWHNNTGVIVIKKQRPRVNICRAFLLATNFVSNVAVVSEEKILYILYKESYQRDPRPSHFVENKKELNFHKQLHQEH